MTAGQRMVQDWLQPHIVDTMLKCLAICGTPVQDLLSRGHLMKASNVRCIIGLMEGEAGSVQVEGRET